VLFVERRLLGAVAQFVSEWGGEKTDRKRRKTDGHAPNPPRVRFTREGNGRKDKKKKREKERNDKKRGKIGREQTHGQGANRFVGNWCYSAGCYLGVMQIFPTDGTPRVRLRGPCQRSAGCAPCFRSASLDKKTRRFLSMNPDTKGARSGKEWRFCRMARTSKRRNCPQVLAGKGRGVPAEKSKPREVGK